MLAPNLASANYLRAFQTLMSRGHVWSHDQDAIQTQVLSGLTQIYSRQTGCSDCLLADSFPGTTYELLPEWESTLGLPDPCAGESPTVQQRRAQVVARLASDGGQSAAYYIGLAAKLGYGITITNLAPFRCGQSSYGQALGNADWFFTWSINSPSSMVVRLVAGQSSTGEPLGSWNDAVLECEVSALKSTHVVLQFRYT